MLDYRKAFQSVDYDILIAKLKAFFNISDSVVSWIRSYLVDREQFVMGLNKSSSVTSVSCSVPQGIVLGPLLFALYINDISDDALTYCRYHLYAVDLQSSLSSSPSELHQAINKVNQDLESLVRWSLRHDISINPKKSQAMLLASKHIRGSIHCETLPPLIIDNTAILLQRTVKDLGLILDHNLSWKDHVKQSLCIFVLITSQKTFFPMSVRISS